MISQGNLALALRSVTLRGVGSYLHGARLDVRPLTILCGTNGSGKSTWFRVLHLLRRSYEKGLLPFEFDPDDNKESFHDLTNAYLKTFGAENLEGPEASHAELQYGPLGTVGLSFEATTDTTLPLSPEDRPGLADEGSLPQGLLWFGHCPKGTRFTVWLAHPDVASYGDIGQSLCDLVELTVNDRYILRFRKSLARQRRGADWESVERYHTLEASLAFLRGHGEQECDVRAFTQYRYDQDQYLPLAGSTEFDLLAPLCTHAVGCIRSLLGAVLSGFFYISAVRLPEYRPSVAKGSLREDHSLNIARREVGEFGEATWDIERAYAYNLMREAREPDPETSPQQFSPGQIHDPAGIWREIFEPIARASATTPERRLWDLATPESREAVSNAARKVQDVLDAGMRESRRLPNAKQTLAEALARLFNDTLGNRNLHRPECWPIPPAEADRMVKRGIENLRPAEVHRLNRLLIESVFNKPGRNEVLDHAYPFLFETYVSYWLNSLLRTRIVMLGSSNQEQSLSDTWAERAAPPAGFLVHPERRPEPPFESDLEGGETFDESPDTTQRFHHPCFGEGSPSPASPRRLSAGFHQIAPLVVQAGLLLPNEVMAVENPEVHLHPSLQLQVTELLLHEAANGKTVLIETHSDLVVRRVMRAILEEDLAQEAIRLYFSDLTSGEAGYHYSTLEHLRVNKRGEIENWPSGFMDTAVIESRRLLDAMYGSPEGLSEDKA
jgi:predicted ATPase